MNSPEIYQEQSLFIRSGRFGYAKARSRTRSFLFKALFSLVISMAMPAVATAQATSTGGGGGMDREDAIEVFSRDVFVVLGASLRNPTIETATNDPLYNVAAFNLGVTWGEWKRATATSRMHCAMGGSRTDIQVRLNGLVPNGVYSLFYATIGPDSVNPLCPGVERSLPLTSKDPDQQPDMASFAADENGEADFQARVPGCLLDATQVFLSLIYHADGRTYGSLPNAGEFNTQGSECRSSFGHDAMRQILILQKW